MAAIDAAVTSQPVGKFIELSSLWASWTFVPILSR
jgi:hypothetical protein